MNIKSQDGQMGFSSIQLLITIAVIAIVVSFAFIGITSARAHIRRSNSARQFAGYVERARADAVRRHGQASIQQINATTYAVTMDFSDSGTVTTQNFSTETGVTINMPWTVTFDWRGRIPVETSVGFTNEVAGINYSNNVDITGSGDVTIDAEIFHDLSIPAVTLNGSGGSVVPDPTPTPGSSPTPSPSPSASPSASPAASPSPSASPAASPTPSASPSSSPTPVPCSISAPTTLTIAKNSSATVSVNLNNFSGSGTITATPSNSGQIQVEPTSATVSGTSSVTFTITVKKQDNDNVTFSSSCGSQTVSITVN